VQKGVGTPLVIFSIAYSKSNPRAGLKPMQLHWAPRHGVWVDGSFLPDTPCAWEFSRSAT